MASKEGRLIRAGADVLLLQGPVNKAGTADTFEQLFSPFQSAPCCRIFRRLYLPMVLY